MVGYNGEQSVGGETVRRDEWRDVTEGKVLVDRERERERET